MRNTDDYKTDKSLNYKLGVGVFVMLQLGALFGLFQAEKYHAHISSDWLLQFDIITPWVFMAGIGIGIWHDAIKGKIERQRAGALLMFLGFTIFYAYQALGKFAAGH